MARFHGVYLKRVAPADRDCLYGSPPKQARSGEEVAPDVVYDDGFDRTRFLGLTLGRVRKRLPSLIDKGNHATLCYHSGLNWDDAPDIHVVGTPDKSAAVRVLEERRQQLREYLIPDRLELPASLNETLVIDW